WSVVGGDAAEWAVVVTLCDGSDNASGIHVQGSSRCDSDERLGTVLSNPSSQCSSSVHRRYESFDSSNCDFWGLGKSLDTDLHGGRNWKLRAADSGRDCADRQDQRG